MSAFVELDTAALEGLALDWAVGIAEGLELELPDARLGRKSIVWCQPFKVKLDGQVIGHDKARHRWAPSTDWAQGGPLIDKYRFDLTYERHELVYAYPCDENGSSAYAIQDDDHWPRYGHTALIAICRALVHWRLGAIVRVPAELVERVQGGGGIA